MKKVVLITALLIGVLSQVNAQESNKFRFDVRLGYATPTTDGGGGVLINLEPKWTLNEKMNIGLRLGLAAYGRVSEEENLDVEVGANGSYAGTFDYYFHNGSSSFAPFIGGGIGYYEVANVDINENELSVGENIIDASGKLGGMLRAGFDLGKFRLAGEYNIIGKSDKRNVANEVIGESKNGYIGFSLGFYFGGGKWGN